jgi:hypothetical protein
LLDELNQQLENEQKYADRLRQIKREIAQIQHEAIADSVHAFESGQRTVQHSLEQLSQYAEKTVGRANEASTDGLKQALKAQTEAAREGMDEALGKLGAGSEGNIGNLQLQKALTQRQFALADLSTTRDQINEMKQLEALDARIADERIEHAKMVEEVHRAAGMNTEHEQEQIAKLQNQRDLQMAQSTTRILQLQQQRYTQFFHTLQSGFENAVDSWIRTGEGFTDALRNMLADMVSNFANSLIEMGVAWVEHHAMKLLIHTQTNASQAASDATTAAATAASLGTVNVGQVMSAAAVAAANAFAATAAIPIVGPELAPGVAAGTYATVAGTYGPLAAFETGGLTPSNIGPGGAVALLHGEESVLPRNLTKMLMDAANGGGSGANRATVTVAQTNHYNGFTDESFRSMMARNSKHMLSLVTKGLRKANAF